MKKLLLLLFIFILSWVQKKVHTETNKIEEQLKQQGIERTPSNILKLTHKNFHEFINNTKTYYFVYLYPNACVVCQEQYQILNQLADDYKTVKFFRTNNLELINSHFRGVTDLPALIFNKNDNLFLYTNRFNEPVLKRYIEAHMGNIQYFNFETNFSLNEDYSLQEAENAIKSIRPYENLIFFLGEDVESNNHILKNLLEASFEYEYTHFLISFNPMLKRHFKVNYNKGFKLISFPIKQYFKDRHFGYYEEIDINEEEINDVSQLDKIIMNHSLGTFPEVTDKELSNLIHNKVILLNLLYPSDMSEPDQINQIFELSKSFKKSIFFCKTKIKIPNTEKLPNQQNEIYFKDIEYTNSYNFLSFFNLNFSDLPAIVIVKYKNNNSIDSGNLTLSNASIIKHIKRKVKQNLLKYEISEFLEKYLRGELLHEPTSEEPESNNENNPIYKVVSKNIDSWIHEDKNFKVILLCTKLYTRCHNIKERLERIAELYKQNNKLKFGYIDVIFNEFNNFSYGQLIPNLVILKENVKPYYYHNINNNKENYVKNYNNKDLLKFSSLDLALWIEEKTGISINKNNLEGKEYPPIVCKDENISDNDFDLTDIEKELHSLFTNNDFPGMNHTPDIKESKFSKGYHSETNVGEIKDLLEEAEYDPLTDFFVYAERNSKDPHIVLKEELKKTDL